MHEKVVCFVVCSEFLLNLYQKEGRMPSIHDTATLRQWVKELSKETGIAIKATQTVMTRIWRRVSKMPSERNKLRAGGRQIREYMEREWSLHLEDGEVQSNAEIELEEKVYELDKENKKLQKEVKKAKCKEQKAQDKIVRMSEQILKAKKMGYTPTRGHSRVKSPSKCSKRHQRNLKRKREERCAEALAWLEHDGYLPSKLVLSNTKTGETEIVTLHECEPLQPDESTEDEVDIINMILYLKDRYNISGVCTT